MHKFKIITSAIPLAVQCTAMAFSWLVVWQAFRFYRGQIGFPFPGLDRLFASQNGIPDFFYNTLGILAWLFLAAVIGIIGQGIARYLAWKIHKIDYRKSIVER